MHVIFSQVIPVVPGYYSTNGLHRCVFCLCVCDRGCVAELAPHSEPACIHTADRLDFYARALPTCYKDNLSSAHVIPWDATETVICSAPEASEQRERDKKEEEGKGGAGFMYVCMRVRSVYSEACIVHEGCGRGKERERKRAWEKRESGGVKCV